MPTYDYRCKACKHELDLFQSMSERPKRKCPACGKNQLERLIGMGGGLIFKGKGFWQTDYRSESYTAGEKQEKEAAKAESKPKDGAKDTGKDSSKPAKKKSAKKAGSKKSPAKGESKDS